MTTFDCSCLHGTGASPITLKHHESDEHVTVCVGALRSMARLKADAHDTGGQTTLSDYATEYGWGLWRSEHILYLIPPVAPFAVGPSDRLEATMTAGAGERP